ncbi:cytochrome C oxidase subunit IV family protein [Pseudomonas aeruginosa]|nr:cytochrome C oxidase subunit IV family protein [Pseudomonas aeruginosa]HEJ5531014.1 cytochrome C oxidase subunit IV family protein [Pseudomonas aeruginosa]
MRTLTLCWLALLALAVTGVLLGGAGDSPWLLAAVLACAVAKGWLIGERFMELAHAPALWRRLLLAHAPALWRRLLLAWPLLMALAVGAALYLARMNN